MPIEDDSQIKKSPRVHQYSLKTATILETVMAYITESRKSCYTEHVYILNRFLLYATTISESQRINEK